MDNRRISKMGYLAEAPIFGSGPAPVQIRPKISEKRAHRHTEYQRLVIESRRLRPFLGPFLRKIGFRNGKRKRV